MPGRDGHASGYWGNGPRGRISGAVLLVAALSRTLEAESDRLSLWIPVLFAGGILIYFGLPEEPRLLSAAALVMAATGIYLAARGTGLGLVVGGAALALAAGFATAKLHTEMARAPVLTKEMRGVTVKGWVELYEPRDKARARITLRVIALGELPPEETPYRVRVTLPAASAKVATGEAVSLKATLRPPPEPIVPHGFDFGRTAWFDRLGASGYSTGTIAALADAGQAPFGLQLWAAIDRLRSLVNAPHSRKPPRREGGDRRGADHRRARRHLRGRQSGHAQFRPVPHSLDLWPAHGDHGRHRILAGQGGASAHPFHRAPLPDQEMGGRSSTRRSALLPASIRRGGAHGAVLDHDEHRAPGHDPRPACAHHAQRGARCPADPVGHAGKPVRSELRNVVRRRGRPRRPGRGEQPSARTTARRT